MRGDSNMSDSSFMKSQKIVTYKQGLINDNTKSIPMGWELGISKVLIIPNI